jgi:hypothetical protein
MNSPVNLTSKYLCHILIYKKDEKGNLDCVCLVKKDKDLVPYAFEYAPLDLDIFTGAKKAMKEDLGIDVMDLNKWAYLGHITSRVLKVNSPCFCVDITETEPDPAAKIQLTETPFSEIYLNNDIFLSGMLFKLLKNYIKNDFTGEKTTEETGKDAGNEEEKGELSGMERESAPSPADGEEFAL